MISAADLERQGWFVNEQELHAVLEATAAEAPAQKPPEVQSALLNVDLKRIGRGCLPDDISGTQNGNLKGPFVLQLTSVADVSQPSKASGCGAGSGSGGGGSRLLRLRLTDGRTACTAVEMHRVEQLFPDMVPGTKVLLREAAVKTGLLLLGSDNIKVLGGEVEALREAWEFARRYGGIERPANAEDGQTAPPFGHFKQGRKSRPPPLPTSLAQALGTGTASQQAAELGGGAASPAAQAGPPGAGGEGGGAKPGVERVPSAAPGPGAAPAALQGAARQRLLDRVADEPQRGRGTGRGRGRRRRFDDDEDSGMTLGEYEAKRSAQKSGATPQAQTDEEFARALQRQLDLEDQQAQAQAAPSAAESLRANMFQQPLAPDEGHSARGRGRSGGRGGRGRARSAGRGGGGRARH